ncbi:MAG: PstS family phosphate ABC transporter substrate-binding protein [Dehalococcoidia bacterium]|nr:PstS family phosphate ABC transporter substrate-binding protein [Dehalococcoidia bacterium]
MSKLGIGSRVFVAMFTFILGSALFLIACSAPTSPVSSASTSSQTGSSGATTQTAPNGSALKGRITVSGAFALYPMMVRWAEEFQKINPGVQIDISAGGAGKGATDALAGLADLGMVSRQVLPEEVAKGGVYVASVIDAVVPVASAGNPVKDDLLAKGIKKQAFVDIWIGGKTANWKDIFPGAKAFGKTDLHVYTRSDASGAADVWALFLGNKKQEDLLGVGVYGDPGLAEAVRKDPLGIGFNNIGYAYSAKTKQQVEGLLVIPIDLNENGKIDPEESVYGSLDDITTAITKGVYPSPPARELNLLTLREFKGATREFVKWVLTEGQQYAPEAGYIPLPKDRVQQELDKIK